jgi:dTDP-4-dehydrorhamnose reductase
MAALELWGGIECTRNRVGDRYVDQLDQSGHAGRDGDLERMAALGIRVWRYPVLWERVAPDGLARADWSWPRRRLTRMRQLGLEPIAGLVHHGSGPRDTSLLDPAFPEKLAAYAAAVAERFPWVRRWTPVNEPLSTARFSALDGHWFPHTRTHADFARAIVNECRATALAMAAIRRHVPDAELVYTEDVCRHSSTPGLAVEAAFRNQRRWIGLDLICGHVGPDHPLHGWLVEHGVDPAVLADLEPTPPAVIGANYYVTSDRFLDELPERQPWCRRIEAPVLEHAGIYGETEAVRCTRAGLLGHRTLLNEVWARYGLPVALAEVHVGCTREEQVRWLLEAWDAAHLARSDGADVRAVTAWGAFGLFGWDRLVTRAGGTYEPGLFDVRGPSPRPTALARVASALARGEAPDVPYGGEGWWRRASRTQGREPLEHVATPGHPPVLDLPPARPARPLLVTGSGAFARQIVRTCEARNLRTVVTGRALDPADPDAVARLVDELRPWAVFHAAGLRTPAVAERVPELAERLHATAPAVLANVCASRGLRLLVLSSSRVLSGPGPHDERALVCPRGALGRSQAEGERAAEGVGLVLRCGHIVGLDRRDDVLGSGLRDVSFGRRWTVSPDQAVVVGPALVDYALELLIDGELGLRHVAHRADLLVTARVAARMVGLDRRRIVAGPRGDAARLVSVHRRVLPAVGVALRGLMVEPVRSEGVS